VDYLKMKEEIKELTKVLKEKEDIFYALGKERMPKAKYGNPEIRIDLVNREYCSKLLPGEEIVRIVYTLQNEDEKIAYMNLFGSINGSWETIIRSVTYFRRHGVLLQEGGGWIILNDMVPCNDEEWEEIKKGNFEKFKNNKISGIE